MVDKERSYVRLALGDGVNDSSCGQSRELGSGEVLAHVELDVALLEIVILDLNGARQVARLEVKQPS